MKRVIITGATGFIGRHCLEPLQRLGYEIHAISRKDLDLLNATENEIENLIQKIKPTHFLHLAWVTEHGKFWNSPLNDQWLDISKNLLEAFIRNGGQRFVFAGTCAEYEWSNQECVEGVTLEVPTTLYGKKKKEFTDFLMIRQQQEKSSFTTTTGRVFLLYGPGEAKTRLIPSIIESIFKGQEVQLTDGNQLRDFMFVEDVANAFVALLDSTVIGPVNIATGSPKTIKEVCESICNIMVNQFSVANPKVHFGAILRSAGDPDLLTASVERLSVEVGYTPKTSLTEGLVKTIQRTFDDHP